jgi:hypothetical protein
MTKKHKLSPKFSNSAKIEDDIACKDSLLNY